MSDNESPIPAATNASLKSFIARVEALNEEIDMTKESIKEIYGEAKAAGHDVKIMRKVITMRKKGTKEALDELAKIEHVLEMLAGTDEEVIG